MIAMRVVKIMNRDLEIHLQIVDDVGFNEMRLIKLRNADDNISARYCNVMS